MAKGKFSTPRNPAPEQAAPQKAPAPKPSRKTMLGIGAAVLVLCLAVGGWFLITALTDPYDCRIVENISIGGVEVGGMTRSEAKKALNTALEQTLLAQPLTVILPEETITLSPAVLQPEVDVNAAVKAAYRLGRKEALPENTALSLVPWLKYDRQALLDILENYADRFDTDLQPYTWALTGPQPELAEESFNPDAATQVLEITRGIPDAHLDTDNLVKRIEEYYGTAPGFCRAGNYTLFHQQIPTTLPELPDLNALAEEFSIAAVNADVSFETYQPVPGSYGLSFNISDARRLLNHAQPGETISVPMEFVEPEILRDEVYFRDVLGVCETKHTNDENRNTNLRLLCESLNGLILEPGQEFSYNDSVGQRTRERGYLPAGAYSGLELVQDVGGGVCQGSTTLYNCVLQADLEIVFRINHGFVVNYVPYGLDATVNWGGPDFQFRNSTHFPIKISAEVADGYVKMKLLGTDEKDYYIIMESEYGVGSEGIYARSYKCKYDKETDELISRDLEARSTYMLH